MSQVKSIKFFLLNFLNGFRKLLIISITLVVTTTLLVKGFLTPEWYAKILMAALPSYFASNVAEWAVKNAGEWIKQYKSKG